MKNKNDYYVYTHSRPDNNQVYWVGMGSNNIYSNKRGSLFNKNRATVLTVDRGDCWKSTTESYGNPIVNYVHTGLSKSEAVRLETELTLQIGLENLCNKIAGNTTSASAETRAKMSDIVNQYSKDGTFIAQYPSLMEASRQTGVNFGNISHCCKGHYKTSGGFIWKYKEEDF
jgi:hypothetical protein